MPLLLNRVKSPHQAYAPFLKRLKTIFGQMDQKYRQAAEYYEFHCTGCEDNCCFTRFYHHTRLEYLYLWKGFQRLDPEKQNNIKHKATEVCRKTATADAQVSKLRLMCPLNLDGLCQLYAFRPMICRLHGIPHELRQPGAGLVRAPGCTYFTAQCQGKDYFKFDRTPFFFEMAALEQELRQATEMKRKLKMTVAEMITTF
ncbi:MAG: hypothetical protein KKH68_06520 [Proteobacteria bacterium]|nr:hypothetical protein [Pseudomonadota bacterium]